MNKPYRKRNRLEGYDYSSCGGYFITFCTANKECFLWSSMKGELSAWGKLVEKAILEISEHYCGIAVDHYAVMPNHVHLLLVVNRQTVPISIVINQLKGIVSKQIGHSIWQKLYYDHIIRNDAEYRKIWEYIENNPLKWKLDCYYCE